MKQQAKRVKRIDRGTILEIVNSENVNGRVSTMDQAEMAIPSYLHQNPFIREIFWRRYDKVYSLARIEAGMSVCEFGCGIGAFLPTLTEAAKEVYAIDLFPQYAHALANKLDLDITFAEDMSIIPDRSLDIIFAVEVMEHLDNPKAFTRLFAQKLKPGGHLIMSGPTESWLYKFGRFLIGYNKYHDYHEFNVFQLVDIITGNNFESLKTIRFPSPLLPLFLISDFLVDNNNGGREQRSGE